MLLHHNDFTVWRNGDETIVTKLRIIGEIEKANGRNVFLPQSRFWDTSRNSDPTKRILVRAQFQCVGFNGSDPEELMLFKASVATDRGRPVEFFRKFQCENDYIFEYWSHFPIFAQIDNFLYNKRTTFEIGWKREHHETLRDEYVFHLCVGKHEESMYNS
jgi:hypothetical protein